MVIRFTISFQRTRPKKKIWSRLSIHHAESYKKRQKKRKKDQKEMKIEPRLMQMTVPLKAGHGGINSYKLIMDWIVEPNNFSK